MINFTPKQVRLFGDQQRSAELVGAGHKLLLRLKAFMSFRGLLIGGPWCREGPGWRIVVKSIDGVRDFVDVYTIAGGRVFAGIDTSFEKMLLFWGLGYELINFSYDKESTIFVPGSVACTDEGSGEISLVRGNNLIGEFIKCWEPDTGITQGLASGSIKSCRREWFGDTYEVRELVAGFDYSKRADEARSPSDDLNIPCRMNAGNKSFSKTLGKMTVQAFEYGNMTSALDWRLCAKWRGRLVRFPNGDYYFGAGDLRRTRLYRQGIYWKLRTYDVLFDVWEEAGVICVGACGQDNLYVWFFDEATASFTEFFTQKITGKEFEPKSETPDGYTPIVCGYAQFTVYINRGGYGIVRERIIENTHTIKGTNSDYRTITKTLWNPLNDKLYYWTDEPGEVIPEYGELHMVDQIVTYYCLGWYCLCTYTIGLSKLSDGCPDDPNAACRVDFGAYRGVTYSEAGSTISFLAFAGILIGDSVDRWLWTDTILHAHIVNRTTYGVNRIMEMGSTSEREFAVFDKGYVERIERGGREITSIWSGGDGVSEFDVSPICTSTRTSFTLEDWNVIPDGVAYDVDAKAISIEDCGCSENAGGSHGGVFLRCDEWEAILKNGVDGNGKELTAPAAAFRFADTSKFMIVLHGLSEWKHLFIDDVGDRIFFQYAASPKEIEV